MIQATLFPYPYDGRLDPTRTAVLAIDMQVDFLSADGYFARKGYDPAPLRWVIARIGGQELGLPERIHDLATPRGSSVLPQHPRG